MVQRRDLKTRSSRGFTLGELLIVVVILAIFVTVMMLQFSDVTNIAKEGALSANLTILRKAIGRYEADHGVFPGASDSEGATCPGGGKAGKGKGPDGARKSFAEQLTMFTNRAGQACSTADTEFRFGPYIQSTAFGEKGMPANPITGKNKVNVQSTGNLDLSSSSNKGGWKYDRVSGKIIVDHEDYDDL